MNVLTPMPDGTLVALTPHEANILRGYLMAQAARMSAPDAERTRHEIQRLRAVSEPQHTYDEWLGAD